MHSIFNYQIYLKNFDASLISSQVALTQ